MFKIKEHTLLVLITLFWVVMNVLLWRAETQAPGQAGAAIPVATVWHKMLEAQDASSLDIYYHAQRLGVCRWGTRVLAVPPAGSAGAETELEGMVRKVSGYRVDFDGSLLLKDVAISTMFFFHLNCDTNHAWREISLRLQARPSSVEIRADATKETLWFKAGDGDQTTERTYRFSELQNPQELMNDLAGPLPATLLTAFGLPQFLTTTNSASHQPPALDWHASQTTLPVGKTSLRVYQLRARVMENYEVLVYVGKAGEVLRVELPGGVRMVNTAIGIL